MPRMSLRRRRNAEEEHKRTQEAYGSVKRSETFKFCSLIAPDWCQCDARSDQVGRVGWWYFPRILMFCNAPDGKAAMGVRL